MEIVYCNYTNIIVPKKLPKYAESPLLYGSSVNRLFNQKRCEKRQILFENKISESYLLAEKMNHLNNPIRNNEIKQYDIFEPVAADKNKQQYQVVNPKILKPKNDEKLRVLSPRSKVKIRNKLAAWFAAEPKRFTFVTLSFIDKVDDAKAVKILNNWLTDIRKTKGKFNYLWVIERQENGNPHFHIANTLFWDINEANESWIHYQLQKGLYNENLKRGPKFNKKTGKPYINKNTKTNDWYLLNPFDVDFVKSQSSLGSYVTKYVTKNNEPFKSACWSCSRSISNLFTGYLGNSSDYFQFDSTPVCFSYNCPDTGLPKTTKLSETEYSITRKISNVEPLLFKYSLVKDVNQKILNKTILLENQVQKMRFVQTLPKHFFSVFHHISFVSDLYVKNQDSTIQEPAAVSGESGQGGKLLNTLERWKKIDFYKDLNDYEKGLLKCL